MYFMSSLNYFQNNICLGWVGIFVCYFPHEHITTCFTIFSQGECVLVSFLIIEIILFISISLFETTGKYNFSANFYKDSFYVFFIMLDKYLIWRSFWSVFAKLSHGTGAQDYCTHGPKRLCLEGRFLLLLLTILQNLFLVPQIICWVDGSKRLVCSNKCLLDNVIVLVKLNGYYESDTSNEWPAQNLTKTDITSENRVITVYVTIVFQSFFLSSLHCPCNHGGTMEFFVFSITVLAFQIIFLITPV